MTDGRIGGKRALVTGASSGIGAKIATVLAEHGTHLVLAARRQDRLEALAEDLRARMQVEVLVATCDLEDPCSPRELFERTEGAGLPIDILVNNAGFGTYHDFASTAWDAIEGQLRVNVLSLTELTHLFVPRMVSRGFGHVMNVASIGAYVPTPRFAVYASSKAFVRNFTETLDDELRGSGVRAICVCPGGTRTEFVERSGQAITPSGELAMMSAERCARIAVEKMLAGRRTVIPGLLNAIGMWLLRFLPRATYPSMARFTMDMAVGRGGS